MLPVTFCLVLFLLLDHFAGASSEHFNRILREPSSCPADEKERWSYRGSNDPEYWGHNYNTCNGREQSPIDIDTSTVVSDPDIPKLEMTNYEKPVSKVTVKNNGHTIKLIPEDDIERTINVEGSPYKLVQIHFHWGGQSTRGSEHLIDNSATAMEMHLVHLNSEDEISVIGVRFNETNGWERGCNELQKLVDVFPEVLYKDKTTQLDSDLNLNDLVPENPASFYRYDGSLTTPGCAEGIKWSLLTKNLHVHKSQMMRFRNLYSATEKDATEECKLVNNYRPAQDLNDRIVYVSQ